MPSRENQEQHDFAPTLHDVPETDGRKYWGAVAVAVRPRGRAPRRVTIETWVQDTSIGRFIDLALITDPKFVKR